MRHIQRSCCREIALHFFSQFEKIRIIRRRPVCVRPAERSRRQLMKYKTAALKADRMTCLCTPVVFYHKTMRDPAAERIHSESLSFISEIFPDNGCNHRLNFFPTDNLLIAFSTTRFEEKSSGPKTSLRSIPFVSWMAATITSGRYLTSLEFRQIT